MSGSIDVLSVIDELSSELSMAATYRGEGCWWNEGDEGITERAKEARAAVAELIEAADEVLYELRDKSEAKAALIAALGKARGK